MQYKPSIVMRKKLIKETERHIVKQFLRREERGAYWRGDVPDNHTA